MHCAVCGQSYGLTHACPGIAPIVPPEETGPSPSLRFAPVHYLSEAFKILCWDDAAVRRASRDNNSIVYGLLILALASALPFVLMTFRNAVLGYPAPWDLIIWRYIQVLVFSIIWIVLQIGLAHALAKIFFDAKGSYVAVLRAYLLGQLYRCAFIIPIVGS